MGTYLRSMMRRARLSNRFDEYCYYCRGLSAMERCYSLKRCLKDGWFFVDHLQNMGAQIILCDPHRVVVVGPQTLRGGVLHSPDVQRNGDVDRRSL